MCGACQSLASHHGGSYYSYYSSNVSICLSASEYIPGCRCLQFPTKSSKAFAENIPRKLAVLIYSIKFYSIAEYRSISCNYFEWLKHLVSHWHRRLIHSQLPQPFYSRGMIFFGTLFGINRTFIEVAIPDTVVTLLNASFNVCTFLVRPFDATELKYTFPCLPLTLTFRAVVKDY